MSDRFEIQNLHAIDWYDGVVTGLVQRVDSSRWWLASLLAWYPDLGERIYALVPLDNEVAGRLLAVVSERAEAEDDKQRKWDAIQQALADIRREQRGAVQLLRCRSLGEPVLGHAEVDIGEPSVRDAIGQDIETAIAGSQDAAGRRWIERTSLAP